MLDCSDFFTIFSFFVVAKSRQSAPFSMSVTSVLIAVQRSFKYKLNNNVPNTVFSGKKQRLLLIENKLNLLLNVECYKENHLQGSVCCYQNQSFRVRLLAYLRNWNPTLLRDRKAQVEQYCDVTLLQTDYIKNNNASVGGNSFSKTKLIHIDSKFFYAICCLLI